MIKNYLPNIQIIVPSSIYLYILENPQSNPQPTTTSSSAISNQRTKQPAPRVTI